MGEVAGHPGVTFEKLVGWYPSALSGVQGLLIRGTKGWIWDLALRVALGVGLQCE